jgi:hypothetical protein
VTLKNEQKHQVSYYQDKYSDFVTVYDFNLVKVHDTKGRAVDADKLRTRLRRETLALISADGRPVDPRHLRLYKEDTLVFLLPPQATTAAQPGKDPIAPSVAPMTPPPVAAPPQVAPPLPTVPPEETVPPSGS